MKITTAFDGLTIGELEILHDVGGLSFADLAGEMQVSHLTPRVVKALVYIVGRRDNPDFTLEDAANVRFDEIEWEEPDEEDPTNAAGS